MKHATLYSLLCILHVTVAFRLTEGASYGEGHVQMYDDTSGGFLGVCGDSGWNEQAGGVLCRQLGFPGLNKGKHKHGNTDSCNNANFVVKHWYIFVQETHYYAPASRERKLDFQFLAYVSSSICCIKFVSLISIRCSNWPATYT